MSTSRATTGTRPGRAPATASVFILVLCLPQAAAAQQAVIPFAVAEDGNGNVIGPIVGFSNSLSFPIVRIIDPDLDLPVFLELRDQETLRGPVIDTYYSEPHCEGTVYHDPALSGSGDLLPSSTGYTYSVSSFDSSSGYLFRSDVTDPGVSTPYASQGTSFACFPNESGMKTLRAATLVLHLRAVYPPDYTVR